MWLWSPELGDGPTGNDGFQAPWWALKTWASSLERTSSDSAVQHPTQQNGKGKNADLFFSWASKILWPSGHCLQAEMSGSQGTEFTILLLTPQVPFSRWIVLFFSMTLNLSSFWLEVGCISGLKGTQIIHLMECHVFSTRSKDFIMTT